MIEAIAVVTQCAPLNVARAVDAALVTRRAPLNVPGMEGASNVEVYAACCAETA